MKMLYGCGSENGGEVDGLEFNVDTLEDLISILKQYKEIHLNYFENEDDLDLWIKLE